MIRTCIAVAIAACAITRAAGADDTTWHTYAAFRNDAFTDLTPPLDDQGFTHDNVVSLVRTHGNLGFGGGLLQRLLTSNIDLRRWDQLEVVALAEYNVVRTGRLRVDTQCKVGPTLGGNFGGRYLQNGWHSLSGTGPTLDSGSLADDYPGDRQIGIIAGARARGQLGDDRLNGYGVLAGDVGLGGGVSSLESTIGGSASTRHVGIHLEVALTRYRVTDEHLALPGGYGTGWQLEWRAGFHVAWSRFRISYEYRANEGGSGEPIGVIAFESTR